MLCSGDRVVTEKGAYAVFIRRNTSRWNSNGDSPAQLEAVPSGHVFESYSLLRLATADEIRQVEPAAVVLSHWLPNAT